ncbi:MAG TPA: hypothetical protein VHZ74_10590 [Bryobacteraceae bacterium]|jgi:hypothetical protein|nr:hypothetical protein [Bryobacteraceae bacterium]
MKTKSRGGRLPDFIQGRVSVRQIVKDAAYQRAMHPPRKAVSAEELEQIVYDAIFRNRAHTSPASVLRWAQQTHEVRKGDK